MKNIGIYVHIPFRINKINHRGFLSFYNMDFYINEYIKYLIKEIKLKENHNYKIDSIYIGGGDPSYLDENHIKKILEEIRENFFISPDCEISLEFNPICPIYRIEKYINMGINRFSIKVQTFNQDDLNLFGYDYTDQDVFSEIKLIRKNGIKNINIDMFFGYPEQSIRKLKKDLDILSSLDISHISYYSFNDGEKMEQIEDDKDELEANMLELISNYLSEKDYIQYELNHYTKLGYESVHNLKYWKMEQYIGFGLGANSFLDNVLYKNEVDFDLYFEKIKKNQLPIMHIEKLEKDDLEKTYIIQNLGLEEGINLEKFKEKFNQDFIKKYRKILIKNIEEGILIKEGNNIKFTSYGRLVSNKFFIDLV